MRLMRPEAASAVYLSAQPLSLNFAVCARVHGAITLEQLEVALARLGKRHPLLAVRAVADPDRDYFTDEDVPPIPLRVVDRVNDDDWVGETERDIQRKSSYLTEPMIRCIWMRGGDVSDLILVCDHLIADGRSAVFALRDLLALLADPCLEMEPLIAPPLPELVPPEILERLRVLASAPAGAEPPADRPDDLPAPAGPVCIEPFDLTEPETSALIGRCKAEGVTVQSALCAAFLTPFAERQPDRPRRHAEIPVDLRPRLTRRVGDSYGNMIGLAIIEVDCAPGGGLWDTARDASAALVAMRDEEIFATAQVMISLIGRIPKRPWDIDYDLSISNLGRLDIPADNGRLRLESIYGPIFPATGPKHLILGVSTFAGRMRCTYSSRLPDAALLKERSLELLRSMLA